MQFKRNFQRKIKNQMLKNKKDTSFIDKWFDEIEDPIISNFNLIGMLESFIDNSIFDDNGKKDLMEKMDVLKESQVNDFIDHLKDHQKFNDPKDQFQNMHKRGVFMDFADQN